MIEFSTIIRIIKKPFYLIKFIQKKINNTNKKYE